MFVQLGLLLLAAYATTAYPIYGTKRYGRTNLPHQNNWMHLPSFYYQAIPRHYEMMNPYEYDDYYYQDPTYPLYYPPYIPYTYYYPSYYENQDPIGEDLQVQEEEREQREEALPIGQETWFESETEPDTLDDVNAAFMKNLMLYNNAQQSLEYQNYDDLDTTDDEDVQELKNLNSKEERMQMFQKVNRNPKITRYQPNDSNNWMKYGNKRALGTTSTTTTTTTTSTEKPVRGNVGQKEVVMMRPATPVRRPFSEPVMKLLAKQGGPERKRAPSVYDTIKHMLEMEKSLEKDNGYYRVPMKKRFVSSEESLVEELSGLKKTAS